MNNDITFSVDKIVRANVAALKPYSSARDEYVSDGSKMIFLDANENPFETGVNRYPDPQQRSLKAILADQNNLSVNQILLGNGSDEVLDLLFRAFCEPNQDEIITLPPTYGMYGVLAGINSIKNKEVVLTKDFQPNTNQIVSQVTERTKIIFLCSPNNPTGNSFSDDAVEEILSQFNGIVVIDEAYIDFSNKASYSAKLQQFPNLVITQTLSKAYGLAGIRLGICYASQEIIEVLNKIKPPYNVNELTQTRATERVLNNDAVAAEIMVLVKERERLSQALKGLAFVTTVFPSEANFLLARVDNATKRYNELLAKGIVVRNRTNQALCENTLRFTIGKVEENDKLITVLKGLD